MTIHKAMLLLRKDAEARGMLDLTIVYGWSAIRCGDELIRFAIETNKFLTPMFPVRKV